MSRRIHTGSSIGMFSKTTDPAFVEAAGLAGLDFLIIDMEHGPSDFKTVENLVRAAEVASMNSIVRVASNDSACIGRALDTGASGVQVPNVTSAETARAAIQAARFHPQGNRGVCRFVRAARYGSVDAQDYFESANRRTVVLMIEGVEAFGQIDEIIRLPGYDVLFVGPYDLSQSLGIPGQIDHPEIENLMRDLVAKTRESNKVVGTFFDDPARRSKLSELGIGFLAYSVDVEVFRQACSKIANPHE